MASDPAIIMLDEPLSALDSYLRWQLELNLQRTLAEFPGTTLYVSHNRDEVYRLCAKVCVINNGRSEPVKSVAEFFDAPPTLTAAILSGCKNFSRAVRIAPAPHKDIRLGRGTQLCARRPGKREIRGNPRALHKTLKRIRRRRKQLPRRNRQRARRRFHNHRQHPPRSRAAQSGFGTIRVELSKEEAKQYAAGEKIHASISPNDVMPLLP